MKYLLFFIILFATVTVQGQCNEFDNLLQKGDNYLKGNKPNYQEAINAYTAAILACSDRAGEAKQRITKMVSDINKLKENAVAAEKKATVAETKTQLTLAQLKEEQVNTKSALAAAQKAKNEAQAEVARSNRLVKAYQFYANRFALTFGDIKENQAFYFIDVDGERVEKLGEWETARPFDQFGYAKVSKKDTLYMLDTFGLFYRSSYNICNIPMSKSFMSVKGSNCFEVTKNEADRFYAIKCFEKSAALYRAAKNCADTNQKQRQELSQKIAACQEEQKKVLIGASIGEVNYSGIMYQSTEAINLNETQFSSFPIQLLDFDMTNLKILILSGNPTNPNNFQDLPKEIYRLSNLHTLYLQNCLIDSLPDEIGALSNLVNLYLKHNRINKLPNKITGLRNLKYLDLRENPISEQERDNIRRLVPWCKVDF